MWRGFQRHHAHNTHPHAAAPPRPRKQASQHASSSLFCFCFFFVPVTQWQWGAWAHEACCMRPKHTTRPCFGVGGVGVCCGPEPTWGCSRTFIIFVSSRRSHLSARVVWRRVGLIFYFCKKKSRQHQKKGTPQLGVSCFQARRRERVSGAGCCVVSAELRVINTGARDGLFFSSS